MAIRSNTRTIHTITIDLPDDVLGRIEAGDEVEVEFTSHIQSGRLPRPFRLSWAWRNFLLGNN